MLKLWNLLDHRSVWFFPLVLPQLFVLPRLIHPPPLRTPCMISFIRRSCWARASGATTWPTRPPTTTSWCVTTRSSTTTLKGGAATPDILRSGKCVQTRTACRAAVTAVHRHHRKPILWATPLMTGDQAAGSDLGRMDLETSLRTTTSCPANESTPGRNWGFM